MKLEITRFKASKSINPPLDSHQGEKTSPRVYATGMQRHPENGLTGALVLLANEAQDDRVSMTGFGNELDLAAEDGWALLAKYGDWPHKAGIQRFQKPQAEEMVNFFNNGWNRVKRVFVGSPIFRGHPDVKELANQYPDKTVYGSTTGLQARDDGLYYRPVLHPDGADQVTKKGAKYSSAHWLAREMPSENGNRIFSPVFLVSVGLTPNPNIPNQSLANANPDEPMNPLLAKILALLSLANEATEEQALARIKDLVARPEPTALANEQQARTAAETKIATLERTLAEANTALANERTALTTAKAAHGDALIDAAIAGGRITEAQKPIWQARLKANFEAECTALANESKSVVKTAPVTKAIGARKAPSAAGAQFQTLVNEAMTKSGIPYDLAWAQVKRTPEGKALLDSMEATETTKA